MPKTSSPPTTIAIQESYRHVFCPSRNRVGSSDVDLAHSAIDVQSAMFSRPRKDGAPASSKSSAVLRELKKLRTAEDEPDSPAHIRDRTPLKKRQPVRLSPL